MSTTPTPDPGGAFYDEPGVADAYLAARHAEVFSPNLVMEEPAFLHAMGDVQGLSVADLGCGDGAFAQDLLALGARSYLGIDGSSEMVRHAMASVSSDAAHFVVEDLESLDLDPASFDLITARMSLHYLSNLTSLLATANRALTERGRIIFSVVHPVITSFDDQSNSPRTSWTVDDYFSDGPRQRAWFGSTVTWQHRTIEHYVSAVVDAGFRIDGLSECEPQPERFDGNEDELARRRRVPLMLLIAASRL